MQRFLQEIAVYDEYVNSKIDVVCKTTTTTKNNISNVITENKMLKEELALANREISELRLLQESLGDLKANLRGAKVSQTDFQILN